MWIHTFVKMNIQPACLFPLYALASHSLLAVTFSLLCSLSCTTFYLFSTCLTYYALTSIHWFGQRIKTGNKAHCDCGKANSPPHFTAGQAEEVGLLLIESRSRWPIADGPQASQCGYCGIKCTLPLLTNNNFYSRIITLWSYLMT